MFLLGEDGKVECKEALDVTVETNAADVGEESDKEEAGEKIEGLSWYKEVLLLDVNSDEVDDIMKKRKRNEC